MLKTKFKVGDCINRKNSNFPASKVTDVLEGVNGVLYQLDGCRYIPAIDEKLWELVSC